MASEITVTFENGGVYNGFASTYTVNDIVTYYFSFDLNYRVQIDKNTQSITAEQYRVPNGAWYDINIITSVAVQEITSSGSTSTLVWLPNVDINGNISWTQSDTTVPPETRNIKGADGAPGERGPQGLSGADGYSPKATVTPTLTGATISITDKDGTTTANITNGADGTPGAPGETGPQGPSGVGVPIGGTIGQVLSKKSDADYDTEWVQPTSGGLTMEEVQEWVNANFYNKTDSDNKYVKRSGDTMTGHLVMDNCHIKCELDGQVTHYDCGVISSDDLEIYSPVEFKENVRIDRSKNLKFTGKTVNDISLTVDPSNTGIDWRFHTHLYTNYSSIDDDANGTLRMHNPVRHYGYSEWFDGRHVRAVISDNGDMAHYQSTERFNPYFDDSTENIIVISDSGINMVYDDTHSVTMSASNIGSLNGITFHNGNTVPTYIRYDGIAAQNLTATNQTIISANTVTTDDLVVKRLTIPYATDNHIRLTYPNGTDYTDITYNMLDSDESYTIRGKGKNGQYGTNIRLVSDNNGHYAFTSNSGTITDFNMYNSEWETDGYPSSWENINAIFSSFANIIDEIAKFIGAPQLAADLFNIEYTGFCMWYDSGHMYPDLVKLKIIKPTQESEG